MRIAILLITIVFSRLILFAQSPSVELRGVWVASISNIDWPSAKNLSVREIKNEIVSVLDFYKEHNFNSVFVQVRPSADTFYPSKYEPWSKYLTGVQGKRPGIFFDPMKFWIKESHKREIEFHAWINPYRITNNVNDKLDKKHPAILHPEWVVSYGGKKYYNPGLIACRDHINNIVAEIVEKYKVDGIHFDDYFYPYPINGINFPDSATYINNKQGFENIEDWRRENINNTIKTLHATIKTIEPTVKFGISPFGVWRNKSADERGSETQAGITNYDHLYADIVTWLKNEWIDYVTPQLYWSTENQAVPFEHLSKWWSTVAENRAVYIGHALYKLNRSNENWQNPQQMFNQINIVRNDSLLQGSVYFRHKFLEMNQLNFTDSLKNKIYKYPAIIPPMPWISSDVPMSPNNLCLKETDLHWEYSNGRNIKKPNYYAVYALLKGGKRQLVLLCNKAKVNVNTYLRDKDVDGFQVTAVNKSNNESQGSNIVLIK